MQSLLKKSLSKQSFSKAIALLCLLLTFVSAAALITHHHSSADRRPEVHGLRHRSRIFS